MIAVAENMASTPVVRDRFADPFAAQVLAPEVDRAVALSGAGLAEILDPDGTIRVSSDPSRIGSRMDFGPSRADEGRAWFGDDDVDGVHSLVGQVPILSIERRRAGGRVGERARIRRCGSCSAAQASGCCSTSASVPRSACWRRGCCPGASNGTPAGWRSPRSPASPIIGKRCCTAFVRVWSR